MPLLTVLMPVYNAEKFVGEAIDSILAQTMQDFEFLIIDDASTDNSVDIIRSYNDPRIKLIGNPANLGISKTLNKGIELATTEIIARMDADDISHARRLQRQYDFMQNNPECALLSCWVNVITEEKQFIRREEFKSRFYYYNMIFDCWMYHPTVMYKRSAVLDVGGYKSSYAEDFDLFWHVSRKYKLDNIEEALLDYRVTSQSLHQVTHKKEYDEALRQQILRNIAYYTGNSTDLKEAELECIRFNFAPILKTKSIPVMIRTLKKLDKITDAVLETPNVNLNFRDTATAAYFRRSFIIRSFKTNLPPVKSLLLKVLLKFMRPQARFYPPQ
jgi:glycosyltransferase involved in cell wall biosynthesis